MSQLAGASDGEAGFLLAVLSPDEGLVKLANALESDVPLARQDAAAALGVLGTPEALALLRRTESFEAQDVLSVVRGFDPDPGSKPQGDMIPKEFPKIDGVGYRVKQDTGRLAAYLRDVARFDLEEVEDGLWIHGHRR